MGADLGAIDRLLASRAATFVAPAAASAMADDSERPLPGRSLIPVAPHRSLPRSCRPAANNATFLAQLIATKQKLPQTRERRRADPADANAAYGAVEQASGGVVTGRAISRIA